MAVVNLTPAAGIPGWAGVRTRRSLSYLLHQATEVIWLHKPLYGSFVPGRCHKRHPASTYTAKPALGKRHLSGLLADRPIPAKYGWWRHKQESKTSEEIRKH